MMEKYRNQLSVEDKASVNQQYLLLKKEIEASRNDINQGLFINQTDLDIEIAEWLKES